ncbi:unnamed protein product, partial [Didymodactylos carnosus]
LRWDFPLIHRLKNLKYISEYGSQALWVDGEFGGTVPNIFSIMTGLHVEHHGIIDDTILVNSNIFKNRSNYEPIPITNENVGGHTRLFQWPFDPLNFKTGRKGKVDIIEPYRKDDASLFQLSRRIPTILKSLADENDRTNFVMTFANEPYWTMASDGVDSDSGRRIMSTIDRLLGKILLETKRLNLIDKLNLLVIGDHGLTDMKCSKPIYLYNYIPRVELKNHTAIQTQSHLSLVLYPKSETSYTILLNKLKYIPRNKVKIYTNTNNIPTRLRLPIISKTTPIIVIPKSKYYLSFSRRLCDRNNNITLNCADKQPLMFADHSNDPRIVSMRSTFLALGPAFKQHHLNDHILITDIYPLLREILCLSNHPKPGQPLAKVQQMLNYTAMDCKQWYLFNSLHYRMEQPLFTTPTTSMPPTLMSKIVRINIASKVLLNRSRNKRKKPSINSTRTKTAHMKIFN